MCGRGDMSHRLTELDRPMDDAPREQAKRLCLIRDFH